MWSRTALHNESALERKTAEKTEIEYLILTVGAVYDRAFFLESTKYARS